MKPLTRTQTALAMAFIFGSWAFLSNEQYKEEQDLYVYQIMEQAKQDELNKPRETLNRMQEDAGELLALQEVK